MQHLSTAFLIFALVIVVNGDNPGVADEYRFNFDQLAEETNKNAFVIIDGPKYVAKPEPTPPSASTNGHDRKPEQRPPSKPPNFPDKPNVNVPHKYYVDIPRPYYQNIPKLQPRPQYSQPLKLFPSPNSLYNYPKVIPLPHHKKPYYGKPQQRPIIYATPNNKTVIVKSQSPKFSLPVQTITGVRKDYVKPPRTPVTVTTTTGTTSTTTKRPLRTKRIWPKRILEKMNANTNNTKSTNSTTPTNSTDRNDHDSSSSIHRIRYVFKNGTSQTPAPKRRYRPVTRIPKIRATTPSNYNNTFEQNDWIPIFPPHYQRGRRPKQTPISRRSDVISPEEQSAPLSKRMLYLQSFGLVPVQNLQKQTPEMSRKKMVYHHKKRQLNPYYSGYSVKPDSQSHYAYDDLQAEGSHHHHGHHHHPRVVTKIKHHHHHHHHRYVKTVERPVKVEVPKPYPVTVEKKVPVPVEKIKLVEKQVPYPVTVEKKVPYPVGIKVPHPVPYKVIEKEYVPKPYPVVHHVPVHVEKRVPYPVEVRVPVDRPVPYPVKVEKKVPYPVPVKVLVPQPYPVETKVPYPVQVKVKEPYEVIKHVPVKVPYPQPFAVKVLQPYPVTVEKRVPYPVEVEKKVPVPVEVLVPQRVEVEKRVPVYIPKPYPVEKKVPVPVKVPYPVKVPVNANVPIYYPNPGGYYQDNYVIGEGSNEESTDTPPHTVTVHGNTGFTGFHSRSDHNELETVTTPVSA